MINGSGKYSVKIAGSLVTICTLPPPLRSPAEANRRPGRL
jgi:hypothetical protein